MGLFDSLLGNVNTGPIRRAGNIQAAAYGPAAGQLTGQTGQAINTLTGQAIPALQGAEQQAVGTLQGALPQGISYLQQGYGQAGGDINQALGLYSPLAQTANQAFSLYNQALSGGPAAQQAFQDYWNSTGAQAELEKGTTGLERMANSRGMLSSGNLTQDEIDYMTNAVRGGYQGWLGDLWNQGALAPSIAGAQSGLYNVLAGQGIGLGQQEAGLTQGTAQQVAGLQNQLGTNLTNIYGDVSGMQGALGPELANLTLGKAGTQAGTLANIFNAQQQAGANALGFWGNLLGGITSGAGRYFGSSGGQAPGTQLQTNFG